MHGVSKLACTSRFLGLVRVFNKFKQHRKLRWSSITSFYALATAPLEAALARMQIAYMIGPPHFGRTWTPCDLPGVFLI